MTQWGKYWLHLLLTSRKIDFCMRIKICKCKCKALRMSHKTTFDTLRNTLGCHAVPRLPRIATRTSSLKTSKSEVLQIFATFSEAWGGHNKTRKSRGDALEAQNEHVVRNYSLQVPRINPRISSVPQNGCFVRGFHQKKAGLHT